MEMIVSGLRLIDASQKQFHLQVNLKATKRPGGQTAQTLLGKIGNNSTTSAGHLMEFSTTSLSEGFILDGYFLGTFEFDSLTGHPGIRY
ncbi:hypothetical protein [Rufibacter latericius]|uniref:hypothetical protein n=1 Tax=Rufibacter latericius TaxID=2487040 RepID=UPI000F6291E0|nr:hypothetical protein [Rufibacter latericius]